MCVCVVPFSLSCLFPCSLTILIPFVKCFFGRLMLLLHLFCCPFVASPIGEQIASYEFINPRTIRCATPSATWQFEIRNSQLPCTPVKCDDRLYSYDRNFIVIASYIYPNCFTLSLCHKISKDFNDNLMPTKIVNVPKKN